MYSEDNCGTVVFFGELLYSLYTVYSLTLYLSISFMNIFQLWNGQNLVKAGHLEFLCKWHLQKVCNIVLVYHHHLQFIFRNVEKEEYYRWVFSQDWFLPRDAL